MKKSQYSRIYAPALYMAGWYSSSQLNAIKASFADQVEGNSSSTIASFIVLVTVSAYLIWKASEALTPNDLPTDDSLKPKS